MKLGILLTTSPESENTHTVIKLAEAALSLGDEVRIFLMCDGVYNLRKPDFLSLVRKGAEIALCTYNAQERGVTRVEGVLFGSQDDLAHMVHDCDRFLAFN